MEVALVKVRELRGESLSTTEEFLIQYSPEDYPHADDLRLKIEEGLERYLLVINAKRKALGANPINAKVTYVALEANELVGHFFESSHRPEGVKRARTFIIRLDRW